MRVLSAVIMKGLVVTSVVLAILIGLFRACDRNEMRQYYSDKENYILSTATVENIIYPEDDNRIVLWLTDLDKAYQDSVFEIEDKNAQVVLNNGFAEYMEIGCEIEFIAAPRYFGDGYVVPIVGLTVDGVELLSFDEGYENLMESYK